MGRHVLVLGDQLTRVVGPLAEADPATTTVLLVESDAWARRRPYHRQKLVLVWSAMRHFAAEVAAASFDVAYRRSAAFEDGLPEQRERLRRECERRLPAGPIVVTTAAWAARGVA